MPVPTLNGLPPFAEMDDIKKKVNSIVNELNNFLVNLDTLNIIELNAKVIIAESITGDKIQANAITADKIVAGAITAGKIDVDELSAITAKMGKLTSGEIYGAYIATSEGLFPRCEMSSEGNLFGAFSSAQHYIAIDPAYAGTPALKFFYAGLEYGRINNMSGVMDIVGTGGIDLYTGSDNLRIPSFGKVLSSTGQNLGVELDSKASTGRSTGWSGDHNHGIPPGTVLRTADGGTVTFASAPQHTHEQLA